MTKMYPPSPPKAYRLELERSILSSSLRLSLEKEDGEGIMKAAYELALINPDLVPEFDDRKASVDYYKRLGIDMNVNPDMVAAAFHKEQKKLLREGVAPDSNDYFELLNAGAMLRSKRLRISHDLVIAHSWLKKNRLNTGVFDVEFKLPKKLPLFLEILKAIQELDELQVKTILIQRKLYPEIQIVDLVKLAEYLEEDDFYFFQRAEDWIANKLMSISELHILNWNKKMSGQSWDDFFRPPGDLEQPIGVPRKPLPDSGSGSFMLELPEPQKSDPENDLDFSP